MTIPDFPSQPRNARDHLATAWSNEVAARLRGPLKFGMNGIYPALLHTDGSILASFAVTELGALHTGNLWVGARLALPSGVNQWNLDNPDGTLRIFREDLAAFPHGGAGGIVRLTLSDAGVLTVSNNVIGGTAGRNLFKDSERSDGLGLRVGASWGRYGIYSEIGDLVLGSATGWVSIGNPAGPPKQSVVGHRFYPSGTDGVLGAHLGEWGQGQLFRGLIAGDGSYMVMRDNNTADPHTYVGAMPTGWVVLRPNNNDPHRQVFVNAEAGLHIGNPLGSAAAGQVIHRDGTNSHLYIFTSSRRFKGNIKDINENLTYGFDKLRVRTFDCYTGDPSDPDLAENRTPAFSPDKPERERGVSWDRIGFIAEEVAEVMPEVVRYGTDGQPEGIDESALLALLIAKVQELSQEIRELKSACPNCYTQQHG